MPYIFQIILLFNFIFRKPRELRKVIYLHSFTTRWAESEEVKDVPIACGYKTV